MFTFRLKEDGLKNIILYFRGILAAQCGKMSPDVAFLEIEKIFSQIILGQGTDCHLDFAIDIGYLYVGSSNFTILLNSL